MRTALIPFSVLLLATSSVSAQRAAHGGAGAPAPHQAQAQPQHRPSPPPPMPAPPPRTVAPPIVFPMGPLTTPPSGGLTAPVTFVPGTGTTPPRDIFLNGRRNPYGNYATPYGGYGAYGGYGSYATDPNATSTSPTPPAPAAAGFLRVSGTPAEAQVFVDGYFVGTLADIEAGRPLMIDAGPHRLELRAPGYQSTSVDIRLAPNDTLTYRAALDRVQPPPSAARTAASSTMYLIPNCYLGNVPPRANRLSPGCDIKQVQVLGAK